MSPYLVLVLFFFLLYHNDIVAIQHRIVLTNVTTVADPEFGNMSISYVDSMMNFDFYNIHTIQTAIVTNELFVKTSEFGEYTKFFKISVNICDFLLNPQKEPLMYLGYQVVLMEKRNHMYSKCPIKPVKTTNI